MVLVEARHKFITRSRTLFRRHSTSVRLEASSSSLLLVEEEQQLFPCVDFPIQSNFGSPHSASISVFFDYHDRMVQSQSDQALGSLLYR